MANVRPQRGTVRRGVSISSPSSPACGQTTRLTPVEYVLRFSKLIRARFKRQPANEEFRLVDVSPASRFTESEFPVAYDYRKPEPQNPDAPYLPLIRALASTSHFKRLQNIRFLGSLDYAFVDRPTGSKQRYTRAQHSLGVAALAANYCAWREKPAQSARACIAAAMLHDIGHGPFSHTLEPLFKERFGIDHHINSANIILGKSGQTTEITDVLRSYGIDPDEIISILSGEDGDYDYLFSSPINLDTIEGILRSRAYISRPSTNLDPSRVSYAAIFRKDATHEQIVDSFWNVKDEMYHLFIRSPAGVLCDYIFSNIVSKIDNLELADFNSTDENVFKKAPLLKGILDRGFAVNQLLSHLPDSLEYVERRFSVDRASNFFERDDRRRYTQIKKARTLELG